MFEEAGFQLVAESDINANPLDQPSGSEENAELREAMMGIGESDRMTLLFRKAVE